MCRWLAYTGEPILLEELVVKPSHSLLMQSRFARENYVSDIDGMPDGAFPTNGDGFGIGWYGEQDEPGIYREWRPAWSDENLLQLAANIRAGLFFAHLRAAYHGIVQRTNSHPFAYRNWMFQHNGEISGFEQLKRELQFRIREDLYPLIRGTTDSETAFFLALTRGMDEDPKGGLERMVSEVEELRDKAGIDDPIRMTAAASDGENIYAVRYSSNRNSKTLYVNRNQDGVEELIGENSPTAPGNIVLSEPLDDCSGNWDPVPESSFLVVCEGDVEIHEFRV